MSSEHDTSDPPPSDDGDKLRNFKDRFFQGYFGITDIARGFLTEVTPPAFNKRVNWDRMELVRGTQIDDKLELTANDLLWQIPTRDGGVAYALAIWEHQTRPDKWIALRLLRHEVTIWTQTLRDDSAPAKSDLPLICCVVLYQGDEPWNTSQWFREIVDLDQDEDSDGEDSDYAGLKALVPDFRFELVRLIGTPEDDLPAEPLTRFGLTLMQAVIEHKLIEWCDAHAWAINLLLRREDGDYLFRIVIVYILTQPGTMPRGWLLTCHNPSSQDQKHEPASTVPARDGSFTTPNQNSRMASMLRRKSASSNGLVT